MDIPPEFWAGFLRPLFWVLALGAVALLAVFLPKKIKDFLFKKIY